MLATAPLTRTRWQGWVSIYHLLVSLSCLVLLGTGAQRRGRVLAGRKIAGVPNRRAKIDVGSIRARVGELEVQVEGQGVEDQGEIGLAVDVRVGLEGSGSAQDEGRPFRGRGGWAKAATAARSPGSEHGGASPAVCQRTPGRSGRARPSARPRRLRLIDAFLAGRLDEGLDPLREDGRVEAEGSREFVDQGSRRNCSSSGLARPMARPTLPATRAWPVVSSSAGSDVTPARSPAGARPARGRGQWVELDDATT